MSGPSFGSWTFAWLARVGIVVTVVALAACSSGDDDGARSPAEDLETSSVPPASSSACDTTAVITGEGLGALRVGRTVEEVDATCGLVRDHFDTGAEGMRERFLDVEFGSEPVGAIVVDDRVWRVHVESPVFATEDSLGVGAPLSRLLRFADLRGAEGEGSLYAMTGAHCGLSFRLSHVPGASRPGGGWTREALAALPEETEVREVLIFGCDDRAVDSGGRVSASVQVSGAVSDEVSDR